MFNFIKQIKGEISSNFNHFLGISILSIYPIAFFLGTGIVNLCVILINLIFLFDIFKKKKFSFFNKDIFYYLCGLWLIFLFNLVFSIDFQNSLGRAFGFVRYIIFVMALIYYLNINNQRYQKIILTSWSFIFFIVSIDLIYEFISGKNLLGFTSYIPGRLAGFFNDELKIGHFYFGFCLIVLSFLLNSEFIRQKYLIKIKINQKNFIFFCALVIILISFLIGERSNFIKTLFVVLLFIFFTRILINKKNFFFLCGLIIIIFSTINYNDDYKKRFLNQMLVPIIENPILYVSNLNYFDHYRFGIKIFLENKINGVGLKNYRVESSNQAKYTKYNWINSSIHPHQVHIEILSELGIVGYLSFIIFFTLSLLNFKKNINSKNRNFKLAGLFFIISTFLPLIPSGSFFTSHAATIFWMNYAFMNFSNEEI